MISESLVHLGEKKSGIRELFEYGLRQAAVVGKENVYDYSLGNPSVPAPVKLLHSMKNIVIKWAVFLTAFLISLEVSAQNVRVFGVVTDALGPIPGVNIMEEGTTDRKSTRLNSSHVALSRMPSSA